MPLSKLWLLAMRDLGRNRRRSLLTLTAVALGLALLIVMNGLITGMTNDSLQNNIKLRTGHLQLRASSYNEDQLSLQWKDLIAQPQALADQASTMPAVKAAAPVLWASGMLASSEDSAGLQLYGIASDSPLYAPIRDAMVAGDYLTPDDRSGIIIGRRLADSLNLTVGRKASLTVVDNDGNASVGDFTIRGLFTTGIPSYDGSAALMPLSKAQAFTQAGDRASAIVVLLNNQNDTDAVASAMQQPEVNVLTWQQMNEVFIQALQSAGAFYVVLDLIVILIVAVIIANTLLMSVFERIREMGIFSALGMKGRHLMQMFLMEASVLGLAGVIVGAGLGLAGVAYLASVGIYIGDAASSVSGSAMALGSTMYAAFAPTLFVQLALAMLLVILLCALYPAWYAARLQPVEALRA